MLEIFRKAASGRKDKSRMQLWQYDNHPLEIYSNKWMKEKINYIHFNPVE
jgi:hypothetical protein